MRKIFLVLIIPLLFLVLNCDDDNPVAPKGTIPILSNITAPDSLYFISEKTYTISVHVDDPQGIEDIAVVTCSFFNTGSQSPIKIDTLVDDETNGDIVLNDGTFTKIITTDFAQGQAGEYSLVFQAIDGSNNTSETLSHELTLKDGEENIGSININVSLPLTLDLKDINNYTHLITVQADDAQNQDKIEFILMQVFSPTSVDTIFQDSLVDNGQEADLTADDGIFSGLFDITSVNNEVGKFSFRIQADDIDGIAGPAVVKTVDVIRSDNDPPVIYELSAPDTMKLVPASNVVDTIRIKVKDEQELDDVLAVRFYSFNPQGIETSNSPTSMADDGIISSHGDVEANDGIYSVIIILPFNVLPGDYKFVFEAEDKSGFKSNHITHILTVSQ